MNKQQFLSILANQLHQLPTEEVQDILRDYEEYFATGLVEGKSEQAISAALGHPKKIAKELRALYYVETMEQNHSFTSVSRAIWATLGLSFINLIFVLGPFIGLVATIFSLWIAAFVCVVSPILALGQLIFTQQSYVLPSLFFSLIYCGVGILLAIGLYYVTRYAYLLTARYLRFNVSIVKGGKVNA